MLVINPIERISAMDALNHPYFKVDPQPASFEEISNLIKNYKTK